MMTLGLIRPPSGGLIGMWLGSPRSVPVTGITMISPLGPPFRALSETTRAGRMPACSLPTVGLKLTPHTSPRAGLAAPLLVVIDFGILNESIGEGFFPRRVLGLEVCPRLRVGLHGRARRVEILPEFLALEIPNGLVDYRRDGCVRPRRQVAQEFVGGSADPDRQTLV